MDVPIFDLERWQSRWEHRVRWNLAESGVEPLTLQELVADFGLDLDSLTSARLGYPQTNGSDELRERIASLYPGARPDNVLVTTGCAEANFLACWSRFEPDDEVTLVLPNYMQVHGLARALGARPSAVWLRRDREWRPDLDEVTDRLRTSEALVVCNPNNPTGSVLTEAQVAHVADAAERSGAWILADEVYRGAELDGRESPTFWGRAERVLCTGGLSKAYGLPGLRIGWIVGPAGEIERLWARHDYTTIGVSVLSDRIAAAALETTTRRKILERTRAILARNLPVVEAWVSNHAAVLDLVRPRAGAMAWVGCPSIDDTAALAETLRAAEVLVVPAEQFGMRSYVRIGYGGDAEALRGGLQRIGEELARTA
jgi:aspartate/methionine/tyrosine aminotransferase